MPRTCPASPCPALSPETPETTEQWSGKDKNGVVTQTGRAALLSESPFLFGKWKKRKHPVASFKFTEPESRVLPVRPDIRQAQPAVRGKSFPSISARNTGRMRQCSFPPSADNSRPQLRLFPWRPGRDITVCKQKSN